MGFSGAVSAGSASALSLNLPAVQLLEAYGPKRFAAESRRRRAADPAATGRTESGADPRWRR